MNFCGVHWCHEEMIALLAILPFLGLARGWIREKYHRLIGREPACGNQKHTCHEHTDLVFKGPPDVRISPGTVVQNEVIYKTTEPVTIGPDGKGFAEAITQPRACPCECSVEVSPHIHLQDHVVLPMAWLSPCQCSLVVGPHAHIDEHTIVPWDDFVTEVDRFSKERPYSIECRNREK